MPTNSSTGGLSGSSSTPPRGNRLPDGKPGPTEDSPAGSLATDILAEMHAAWEAGVPIDAEQWIARHPELAADPETAVLVIYEEFCLREEAGQRVDPAQVMARFPQWSEALQVVMDCHRLFAAEAIEFPEAGSDLGELHLLRELGRGAVGRVFLASQPSLCDRLLAVKLTPLTVEEHLSLARLQHTHIVPLYLVLEFPQKNLRALCMPYLGGANWSSILQALGERSLAQRSGARIVELFGAAPGDFDLPATSAGPASSFLARSSYVQAVSWLGACLADALAYAHQRGLVHLDIKPSNVLLAADGQPMLLDFHLAHELDAVAAGRIDRIGGTRGYMSREQEQCAEAIRQGRPLPVSLDARSDIFSLGVLLYESLAGELPAADEPTSRAALRRANPQVSRGLEDIVHKCLAADRTARYADADALADDLRRHLADLPLRGVANRSFAERWRKWRRRKPHWLPVLTIGALALAVTGTVCLLFYRERLRLATSAVAEAQHEIDAGDYLAALDRASGGLAALAGIPGQTELKQTLEAQHVLAQHGRIAQDLHRVVEELRFIDNVDDLPEAELRKLDASCRRIWQARRQIAGLEGDASGPPGLAGVRTDLLDLALLWTGLSLRIAPDAQGRAQALQVLDEAQALSGPSPVLDRARAEIADPAAAAKVADQESSRPGTAWEHNAIGRGLMQHGQLEGAQAEFEEAVRQEPNAFWPNFNLVICAYRRGEFELALRAAYVSIALAPHSAECYYNRALCHEALGETRLALADLTKAVELNPELAAAALHRGILLGRSGQADQAFADLQRAGTLGVPPLRVAYERAVVYAARGDRASARRAVAEALRLDPNYEPAVSLQTKLANER